MAASHGHHAGAVLLAASHYAVPLAVVVFFLTAHLLQLCSVNKAPTRTPSKNQRRIAITLTLALVAAFFVEGILNFSKALIDRSWSAPQHLVLYLVFSVVVWAVVGINFVDSADPAWPPYMGAWMLGLAGELEVAALTVASAPPGDSYDTTTFILHLARVTILLSVILATGVLQLNRKPYFTATDEERDGLLAAQNGSPNGYGGTATTSEPQQETPKNDNSDNSEDEDDDKDIKDQQRKRFEEEGGVWGYLKGFAVFIPVLNPKGNPKIQLFYAILGLYLIWERVENVLIPNQIGVITRRLSEYAGTGKLPWKEVAVWAGLRWLSGSAGLSFVETYVQTRIDNFCYKRVNEFAFNHVMSLSMDFHDSKDSAEILKSVEQGTAISRLIETFAFSITPMIFDVVIGVVYITYLFDIYIALIALLTGMVYFWANIRLRKFYLPRRREYVKKGREESNTSYEAVGNWQTVSYFNRSKYEQSRYSGAVDAYVEAEYRYYDLVNVVGAVLSLIMIFGHVSAMYLAAWRVADGVNDVGSFVTLVTYWSQLTTPLQRLSYEYRSIAGNFVDAERLLVLIQTKPTVSSKDGAPDLRITGAEVSFENVNFAYDPRKPILKDVTFTAKSGQTIALVGETGGGKSTTLKLLGRYYDVTDGSIKVDGQDIRDVTLDSLRDAIGVVPQDPSLFNRSILENVRYARLDATDEEVFEACKAAAIHDKIMSFPDQYKAKVGERGVKVSGGEKQRIAIARVILRDPKIVVLDEATSAVDSSTEQIIQEAFTKLSQSRTTFVIAHRLSTIVEADLILVVDEGKIVERGSHDELIRKNGRYTELWQKQTREAKKNAAVAALQGISTTTTAQSSSIDLIQLHDVKVELNGGELTLDQASDTAGSNLKDVQNLDYSSSQVDSPPSSHTEPVDVGDEEPAVRQNSISATGLGIENVSGNDTKKDEHNGQSSK